MQQIGEVIEEMEVTIDKCCTSKETYSVDNIIFIMENLLDDMRNSDGGEGALIVDGQTFYTDAGFALEGVEIFIKLFKQRMGVENNVDTNTEQAENSEQ